MESERAAKNCWRRARLLLLLVRFSAAVCISRSGVQQGWTPAARMRSEDTEGDTEEFESAERRVQRAANDYRTNVLIASVAAFCVYTR
jgi:hypothetical protein